MGGSSQHTIQHKDCPGCGVGKAFMSSSAWGHTISCCSDKCGLKIKAILDKNMSSAKYEKLEEKIFQLNSELSDMKHDGIPDGHYD